MNRRTFCNALAGAAAAMLGNSGCARHADVVAITASGTVRGTRAGSVLAFKGIPYGDTNHRRFMRAAPPEAWTGVRDVLNYGPMAPQPNRPYTGGRRLLESWHIPQRSSENCLVLNVWTSELRARSKRPVMVWVHGGGFFAGSGASNAYDGARLVERGDFVIVTLNHRLNVFGHFHLAELTDDERYRDSGNVGLHDLVAALRWVQQNIGEFGGDPSCVTLFGESGGGQKICCLLAMPEARGLFHRAIVQSGPYIAAMEQHDATETARTLLHALKLEPNELHRLDGLTSRQVMGAYKKLPPSMVIGLGPVVDGRGLPAHPFTPEATNVAADIPLLIGITQTETTYMLDEERNFNLSWSELPDRLARFLGPSDSARTIAEYRRILPNATASEIFFDITTQLIIGRDSQLIADLKSEQHRAPVYFYQLSWRTPVDGGKWRSPHTLEVPLVFDNVANTRPMFGDAHEEAQRVAELMSEAWLAFARTGDPNTRGRLVWPEYESTKRFVMDFNVSQTVLPDPFGSRLHALANAPRWDGRVRD